MRKNSRSGRLSCESQCSPLLLVFKYIIKLTSNASLWCRVSLIFVLVFYTSLNSCGYKIKLKRTLYTAVSIDIDAYYWDTQGDAMFFSWCQMPGVPGPEQMLNSHPPET